MLLCVECGTYSSFFFRAETFLKTEFASCGVILLRCFFSFGSLLPLPAFPCRRSGCSGCSVLSTSVSLGFLPFSFTSLEIGERLWLWEWQLPPSPSAGNLGPAQPWGVAPSPLRQGLPCSGLLSAPLWVWVSSRSRRAVGCLSGSSVLALPRPSRCLRSWVSDLEESAAAGGIQLALCNATRLF